jgi:hypothetical protein
MFDGNSNFLVFSSRRGVGMEKDVVFNKSFQIPSNNFYAKYTSMVGIYGILQDYSVQPHEVNKLLRIFWDSK